MARVIHGLGGLWEIFLVTQRGTKIYESVEDTAILLSQSSCISFGMSNQIKFSILVFESFNVDRL